MKYNRLLKSPSDFLDEWHLEYKVKGKELLAKCPFGDCDEKSDSYHLYVNAETGQYKCMKCGSEGNLVTLAKHLGQDTKGIYENERKVKPKKSPDVSVISPEPVTDRREQARNLNKDLSVDHRRYLNARGLSDETIDTYLIGEASLGDPGSGETLRRITIPIFDKSGQVPFFKARIAPELEDRTTVKYFCYPSGLKVALYGIETLASSQSDFVIITEGEFDSLILRQLGYTAVSSTGGCGTFPEEWVRYFDKFSKIYLCFDNDAPGQQAATTHARKFGSKDVYFVDIPNLTGVKDVSEYFSIGGKSKDDFEKLLAEGRPYTRQEEAESKDEGEPESKSRASQIVNIITSDPKITLFHDQKRCAFISIEQEEGKRIFDLKTKAFKSWLSGNFWREWKQVLNSELLSNVSQTLGGIALYEGTQINLAVRLGYKDNDLFYDLGNGRAVGIDENGWEVVNDPPTLFYNFPSQSGQVEPQGGGSLDDLFSLLNIREQTDQILLKVLLVSYFIPDFPHPLLVFYGPQGSGKTFPQKLIKSLVDPSIISVQSNPSNKTEFIQQAFHHYLLVLDNLSGIDDWLSDTLARLCTGDGFAKRELYSDDDDVIYSLQRLVALNGINLVAGKADLLERTVTIELERISENERIEEVELLEGFSEMKPYILGAIFDTIVSARRIYPGIKLDSYPRMADFVRWGCAIAKALGYSQKDFLDAYQQNRDSQHTTVVETDPIGLTLLDYLKHRSNNGESSRWEDTPTRIFETLKNAANGLGVDIKQKDFPKSAAQLTRKLNLLKTDLLEGYKVKFTQSKSKNRMLVFDSPVDQKSSVPIVSAVGTPLLQQQPSDTSDDTDDGNQRLGVELLPNHL